MNQTTLNTLKRRSRHSSIPNACTEVLQILGGDWPLDKQFEITPEIAAVLSIPELLWSLPVDNPGTLDILRRFTLFCARQLETKEQDSRLKQCNDITEAYLNGKAKIKQCREAAEQVFMDVVVPAAVRRDNVRWLAAHVAQMAAELAYAEDVKDARWEAFSVTLKLSNCTATEEDRPLRKAELLRLMQINR